MKKYIKILVDFGMTVLLLLLMAYERVGAAAHEWLGIALFLLVVLHHVLNRKWSGNLLNGRYRPMRIAQTVLVALVLCAMLGSMASGIVLSRHALAFLPVRGGASWARTVHMLCGYWGFLLMGLHLGLHWGMIAGMISRHTLPLCGQQESEYIQNSQLRKIYRPKRSQRLRCRIYAMGSWGRAYYRDFSNYTLPYRHIDQGTGCSDLAEIWREISNF